MLDENNIPFIEDVINRYNGNVIIKNGELMCLIKIPELGTFCVSFIYKLDYPKKPFKVFFRNLEYEFESKQCSMGGKLSHPNINEKTGELEIELLDKHWMPIISPMFIINFIYLMVREPDVTMVNLDDGYFFDRMKFMNQNNVCKCEDFDVVDNV